MADKLHVGLIQMTSGSDMEKNVSNCCADIAEAAKAGATLILTPEMTNVFQPKNSKLFEACFYEADDPFLRKFQKTAIKHEVWLLIGSMAFLYSADKLANRSILISPKGEIVARYDKLHMFDANLPNGERYEESKSYQAGEQAVLACLPFANLGLSICYDLRFPNLYQDLARAGANILAIPSAFTKTTGTAHWHTLIKARAIETGCFVLAPAQTGKHTGGRETYGHSLIVNPWGDIICDGKKNKGVLVAALNLDEVEEAREKIPSLKALRSGLNITIMP